MKIKLILAFSTTYFSLAYSLFALADNPKSVRWTYKEDNNSDFVHIIDVINQKTGFALSVSDFTMLESRKLAKYNYLMLTQMQNGLPIEGNTLRIWTNNQGQLYQVEAQVSDKSSPKYSKLKSSMGDESVDTLLSSDATMDIVRNAVLNHPDDKQIRDLKWKDVIDKDKILRIVKVKSKHGTHTIKIDPTNKKVVDHLYEDFPNADNDNKTLSVPVHIYPIYEEIEKTNELMPRSPSFLRNLNSKIFKAETDPFAPLRNIKYLNSMFDPFKGLTAAGRKEGYWAPSYVKRQGNAIRSSLPLVDNNFASGFLLEGKYTSINVHPDAMKQYAGSLNFKPQFSGQFRFDYRDNEMVPTGTYHAKPFTSRKQMDQIDAVRLPDHNVVEYMNNGFDAIQVYWAVDQLFQSLQKSGFNDPELSTRPFHAFLYDPDISMKNNAYYTDDTINFTTYSPNQGNMARDNTTIWHELGHGVMDRLMGDYINLAGTGGLSEGMADFVAQMVLHDVTGAGSFPGLSDMRIINKTGFFLTNEVHDDGEAFGGTMFDILTAAEKKFGIYTGLQMMTDLTLDAMRLSRNHPALGEKEWFEHMLFADELGNGKVRKSGAFKELILAALANRNFSLDNNSHAEYIFKADGKDIIAGQPGSRSKPIPVKLKAGETKAYNLTVQLKNSAVYKFKFPVQVKVSLGGGPIQGAIHWKDEEKYPLVYTLNSEADIAKIPLSVTGQCDEINRDDGSCVDYASVQILNNGQDLTSRPVAKKRFYIRMKQVKNLNFES
ncbi:gluzincin family metallopeptidase [Pigmentibacter ruber]|uniref:hypothetical protein n=1 Tax=Pigmentibacter ruber TaxID=2683196 RepID=UPI00131E72CC|nr:hypothetical protein [Pigmentibacter ruber]BFD32548.1 hypothetical protein GTC16762_21660 [Pigmentibacter ruber]